MTLRNRLPPMTRRPRLRIVVLGFVATLVLVACGASPAGPSPSAPPFAPASASAYASAHASAPASAPGSPAPSDSAAPVPFPSRSPGVVGRAPGSVGSAPGVTPIPVAPVGPGASIGPIQQQPPTVVHPVANLLDVHDVRAEAVAASVTGGRVTATLIWWSGPAPCSVLSEVAVARQGSAFTLTVREGAQQLGIACPAIAVHKQATVDLGALPAGTYSIRAMGVDAPVTVAVPG